MCDKSAYTVNQFSLCSKFLETDGIQYRMNKTYLNFVTSPIALTRLDTPDLGIDESTEASIEQSMLHNECLFDSDIDSTLISFSIFVPSNLLKSTPD